MTLETTDMKVCIQNFVTLNRNYLTIVIIRTTSSLSKKIFFVSFFCRYSINSSDPVLNQNKWLVLQFFYLNITNYLVFHYSK